MLDDAVVDPPSRRRRSRRRCASPGLVGGAAGRRPPRPRRRRRRGRSSSVPLDAEPAVARRVPRARQLVGDLARVVDRQRVARRRRVRRDGEDPDDGAAGVDERAAGSAAPGAGQSVSISPGTADAVGAGRRRGRTPPIVAGARPSGGSPSAGGDADDLPARRARLADDPSCAAGSVPRRRPRAARGRSRGRRRRARAGSVRAAGAITVTPVAPSSACAVVRTWPVPTHTPDAAAVAVGRRAARTATMLGADARPRARRRGRSPPSGVGRHRCDRRVVAAVERRRPPRGRRPRRSRRAAASADDAESRRRRPRPACVASERAELARVEPDPVERVGRRPARARRPRRRARGTASECTTAACRAVAPRRRIAVRRSTAVGAPCHYDDRRARAVCRTRLGRAHVASRFPSTPPTRGPTTPGSGAVVCFLGVVRDHSEGRAGVHRAHLRGVRGARRRAGSREIAAESAPALARRRAARAAAPRRATSRSRSRRSWSWPRRRTAPRRSRRRGSASTR